MPQFVNPAACKHARRLLIARDEEAEYWECLECGEIFEPDEYPAPAQAAPQFNESLSDA